MKHGSEDSLLAWLRRRLGEPLLGDDAAVLPAGGPWAVTVDSQIAGVHFPADLDPALVARRALAVNLSDLAAMGAEPAFAFLALAAPHGFAHRRFLSAFAAACREHGLRLAGGDLAAIPERASATVTLVGRKPRAARWLTRGGAAPGEALWLGGTVGESAAGRVLVAAGARIAGRGTRLPATPALPRSLAAAARRAVRRHLLPSPQLELGRWLGRQERGAAIDVSDGLGRDLHRLCRESSAGALVRLENLPFADGFDALAARLERDPLALALGGGEDYVLLFTLPLGRRPPERFGCREIGRITRRRAIVALARGVRAPLADAGWDHLSGSDFERD